MNLEGTSPIATTVGGGFFVGILIGWAVKKVIKLVAVMAGLFLAGLAYLQYQQIASINWGKLEQISEGAVNTVVNATTNMFIVQRKTRIIHMSVRNRAGSSG